MAKFWSNLAKAVPGTVEGFYKGRKMSMDEDKSALEQLYKQKESERLAKAATLDELFKTHSMKNADARLGLDQQKVAPVSATGLFERDPEAAKQLGAFAGPDNTLDRGVYDTYVKTRFSKTPEEIAQIKATTGKTVAETDKTRSETGPDPIKIRQAEADIAVKEARVAQMTDPLLKEKALTDIAIQKQKLVAAKTKPSGKTLPAGQAEAAGFANAASQSLDDALSLINENKSLVGPLSGRVSGIMGSMQMGERGKQAANIDAALKQRAQVIGKYLEGGKLTDADIERYKNQLPTLNDFPEVAEGKVNSLRRQIAQKQQAELAALKAAGYNSGDIQTVAAPELSDLRSGDRRSLYKKQELQQQAPANGPKVGEVVDGYKYIGGDPGNPRSWSKP